ncbi:MAG: NAD kinase [Coprobacillus sp.]
MMKTYTIVHKQDELSKNVALKIKKELDVFMLDDDKNPELIITVGGDGTMLHSVHQYREQLDKVCFVGIHTGTLGFLTDYQMDEYQELVEDIKSNQCKIYNRHLLDIQTNKDSYIALNEFRIENNMRSQVLDVYINQEFFETFRGNGLCVSTASGSTAYNKSLGGAVVYSGAGIMQLSEIAGIHHNAYRSLGSSLILDESHVIRFESQSFKDSILGVDHLVFDLKDVSFVDVKISSQCVRFAQFKRVSLIERLKRSFLSV